jgi:acyl carrier protein
LGVPEDAITETALLRKDLELDSTETVEIALELKRRLDVSIRFEAREDMTLAELCALISQQTPPRATVS